MRNKRTSRGFSLTEVLLAVGVLAVGMTFVAGVFPVAIHFTTISTERTIATIAADEAFAEIQLIVGDPCCPIGASAFDNASLRPFEEQVNSIRMALKQGLIDPNVFAYPSTPGNILQKQYFWSALCRKVEPNPPNPNSRLVQVTVFVCRKIGTAARYWNPDDPTHIVSAVLYPMPVRVAVLRNLSMEANELLIVDRDSSDDIDEETFINDGCTIVDNRTGQIYRVVKREPGVPAIVRLDRAWGSIAGPSEVWVVPPPVNGGRYPCVGVHQRLIRF